MSDNSVFHSVYLKTSHLVQWSSWVYVVILTRGGLVGEMYMYMVTISGLRIGGIVTTVHCGLYNILKTYTITQFLLQELEINLHNTNWPFMIIDLIRLSNLLEFLKQLLCIFMICHLTCITQHHLYIL